MSNEETEGCPFRAIQRRDFLNGMAFAVAAPLTQAFPLGAAGATSTSRPEAEPGYYPPSRTGLRGSHVGSFEAAHELRDQGRAAVADKAIATGEAYDLVIVGGGISGLAAAYFQRKKQPDAKILIIENHDDFGGHAKRNEFTSGGKTLIGYGGTQAIEGASSYSAVAMGLLEELGVDIRKFETFFDQDFQRRNGLLHCDFYDAAHFGRDVLLPADADTDWAAYVEKAPLNPAAKKDLLRIQTEHIDYLPDLDKAAKIARLNAISFADFLKDIAKVDDQVIAYFETCTSGGYGVGIDAISAYSVILSGAREPNVIFFNGPTDALGIGMDLLSNEPGFGKYIYHFPDGNASIARLLVRNLVRGVAPGDSMEDIVTARFDYSRLDDDAQPVRIRLNSTALSAKNVAQGVDISYRRQGRLYSVRGKACVLACWNSVIPYLCPEMPDAQREALSGAVKVPITYTNVLIRNWKAIKAARLMTSYCPQSFFREVYMDFPVSMGGYRYTDGPDSPAVLHLVRNPASPGLSARDQFRAARMELYQTPFEVFEENVYDQLGRMFAPYGFDAKRDIEAITVNRWPHGYAYSYNSLWDPDLPEEQRPHIIGRAKFGRIAIANSDAGAMAETQTAIDMAHRAIEELSA